MKMIPFIPAALAMLLGGHAQTMHQNQSLVVTTKQGDVVGTQVSQGVRRFLGIPYAVAGRWQAPAPPPSHTTLFNASDFSNTCPQLLDRLNLAFAKVAQNHNADDYPEGEDCLTVNIWAPSSNRKQGGAVLLWIYGGGLELGTSRNPDFDGASFVENHEDILLVSFNYRLNIFGQPNAPQLVSKSQSQNFGLLDIDAAVQWVYDNIASFGGDPERITLFGQSAGGVAVDIYSYMHPQDHKVKGLIQMAGNVGAAFPQTVGPAPANVTFDPQPWNTVAKAAGCGTNGDDAQLECMKNKPYATLVQATFDSNLTLVPLVDDITLFSDTGLRTAAGNFLQVPLLAGTTANEQDVIISAEVAVLGYTIPVVSEMLADILTTISLTCPTQQTVGGRLNAKVPTWRYLYDAIFKDISPRPELRAFHTSELPILFGNLSPHATTEEKALSQYMQGAWVAFTRDPKDGLLEYGWPQYNPTTDSVANIGGYYNATGVSFSRGDQLDGLCNDQGTLVELIPKLAPLFPDGVRALLGL